MVYRVLVLPNIENRDNYQKLWEELNLDGMFKIEKGSNIRVQRNGVFEEQPDGTCVKIESEATTFIIHPDSGITMPDIMASPPDASFGNGMSTFCINGKRCTVVVLKKDMDISVGSIRSVLVDKFKNKDKM